MGRGGRVREGGRKRGRKGIDQESLDDVRCKRLQSVFTALANGNSVRLRVPMHMGFSALNISARAV
jgi:hypothetical protein